MSGGTDLQACSSEAVGKALSSSTRGGLSPGAALAAAAERGAAAQRHLGPERDLESADRASEEEEEDDVAVSQAKAGLLAATAPYRKKLALSTRDLIKSCFLADPDMWPCVRSGADAALDRMWADVEHEIERNLHYSVLAQQAAGADVSQGPSARGILQLWWSFRAFVLHHYLPHNRYFFGKLKDPVYVFMYLLTLVPVHGVRVSVFFVVFLMLVIPGPPDEYQLINFILLFKGMQFLTSGVLAMGLGAGKYFACYSLHKVDVLQCIDTGGPGANDSVGLAVDYLGSVALVWIAFALLPYSRKNTVAAPGPSQAPGQGSGSHGGAAGPVPGRRGHEGRAGGRLRHLVYYDMKCFAVTFLSLCLLTAWTCSSEIELRSVGGGFLTALSGLRSNPQFCANVFWCCVLYSLTSLPFAAFAIPGWQTILVHSDPTGYNRQGACVPFGLLHAEADGAPARASGVAKGTKKPRGKVGKGTAASNSSQGFLRVATVATNVLCLLERGREARGAEKEGSLMGDLTLGVWSKIKGGIYGADSEGDSDGPEGLGGRGREAEDERPDSSGLTWMVRPAPAPRLPVEPLQECDLPLSVASVKILKEPLQCDGVTLFCIEVTAEGSLDAEGGVEPWRVRRRYASFRDLARQLGHGSQAFREAPFPPRHLTALTDEMLESRRRALELWLNRVVQDPSSQGPWASALHDFFDPEGSYKDACISSPAELRAATPEAACLLDPACQELPPDPGAMVPCTSANAGGVNMSVASSERAARLAGHELLEPEPLCFTLPGESPPPQAVRDTALGGARAIRAEEPALREEPLPSAAPGQGGASPKPRESPSQVAGPGIEGGGGGAGRGARAGPVEAGVLEGAELGGSIREGGVAALGDMSLGDLGRGIWSTFRSARETYFKNPGEQLYLGLSAAEAPKAVRRGMLEPLLRAMGEPQEGLATANRPVEDEEEEDEEREEEQEAVAPPCTSSGMSPPPKESALPVLDPPPNEFSLGIEDKQPLPEHAAATTPFSTEVSHASSEQLGDSVSAWDSPPAAAGGPERVPRL